MGYNNNNSIIIIIIIRSSSSNIIIVNIIINLRHLNYIYIYICNYIYLLPKVIIYLFYFISTDHVNIFIIFVIVQ